MAKKKHDTSNIDNLLASVTADMLGDGFSDQLQDNSIRVERFCSIWYDLIQYNHVELLLHN